MAGASPVSVSFGRSLQPGDCCLTRGQIARANSQSGLEPSGAGVYPISGCYVCHTWLLATPAIDGSEGHSSSELADPALSLYALAVQEPASHERGHRPDLITTDEFAVALSGTYFTLDD